MVNHFKKIIFCIFLICFYILTHAKQSQLDSLKKIFNSGSHDTTRLKALVGITEILASTNPDTVIGLCNTAIDIVNKNLADANKSEKGVYLFVKSTAINNIGFIYQMRGNIPVALEYYEKSMKIQEEIGDKSGLANSLNNIGFIYKQRGDVKKALGYWNKSLKIRQEINDKAGIANSLNNLGLIYRQQGDIPKAIDYFMKSLKIREEINDKQGVSTSLNNLGLVYKQQGDAVKALEYYLKSLRIAEELGDKVRVAYALNNIGSMYKEKNNYTKAFDYYRRSLLLREEIKDKKGIAESLNNIGYLFQRQGNLEKAEEFLLKSLKIQEEIQDKSAVSLVLTSISSVYLEKGKVNKAFAFATRSMKLAKELGSPENIRYSSQLLYEVYKKQKQFKPSLEMHELYIQMRDSINNAETRKASVKKQFQYEYEKKTTADSVKNVEQLKQEKLKYEHEIQQQKTYTYGGVIGFLLMIIVAAVSFRAFKQKQKANEIISRQKLIVDEKQKEILDSIYYAKRIQTALITSEKYIGKNIDRLNKN